MRSCFGHRPGSLPLTVSSGTSSSDSQRHGERNRAGLLAPPSFQVGANQYVVAQLAANDVAPPAHRWRHFAPPSPASDVIYELVSDRSSRIYRGEIESASNQLSDRCSSCSDRPRRRQYPTLACADAVGLYQFNVVVPQVRITIWCRLRSRCGVPHAEAIQAAPVRGTGAPKRRDDRARDM